MTPDDVRRAVSRERARRRFTLSDVLAGRLHMIAGGGSWLLITSYLDGEAASASASFALAASMLSYPLFIRSGH